MMNTKEFWDRVDQAIEAVENQEGVAYNPTYGHCMYLLGNTSCIVGHFLKDNSVIWDTLKDYRGSITDFVYEFEITPEFMGVTEEQLRILSLLQVTHDGIAEIIAGATLQKYELEENPWSRLREKAQELKG